MKPLGTALRLDFRIDGNISIVRFRETPQATTIFCRSRGPRAHMISEWHGGPTTTPSHPMSAARQAGATPDEVGAEEHGTAGPWLSA